MYSNFLPSLLFAMLLALSTLPYVLAQLILVVTWVVFLNLELLSAPFLLGPFFQLIQGLLLLGFVFQGRLIDQAVVKSISQRHFAGLVRRGLGIITVALCVAPVVRAVPLEYLGWGGVFVFYWTHFRAAGRVKKGQSCIPRRASVTNALLLATSTIAGIVFLEIAVRTLLPISVPQPSLQSYHSEAWWMLTPNAKSDIRFWQHTGSTTERPFSTFNVKISRQGFREREIGPKQEVESRVLLIGDSFTFGFGVEFEDTIGYQLEELLSGISLPNRVTVMNGGVEGYGPWQERILLNERGFALEPDIVVLQVFPTNDIDNTLGRVGKKLRRFDTAWQQELENRRRWGTGPVKLHVLLNRYSALYNAIGNGTGSAAPLIDFLESTRFYPPPKLDQIISKDPLYWLEAERKEWYPELLEGQRLMEQDILAIRDDCQKRGIDFYVYTMPDRDTVCDAFWANCMKLSKEPDSYERGKSTRIMREFYEREQLPAIDVPSAVRNAEDPCALYLVNDGHLNPDGTRIVATALAEGLKDPRILHKKTLP